MKNEKFLRVMGEIDDRILQRYDEIDRRMATPKSNRSHIIRWASLAACLCIMFTSVFFLQQKYGNDENPSVDVGGGEEITQVGTTGGLVADRIPSPLYYFENLGDYKAYLQSENYNLPLLESEQLEAFGTISKVNVWTLNSSDDFRVEYECTYRANDNKDKIYVEIYSTSKFQEGFGSWIDSALLDSEDMGENLSCVVDAILWYRMGKSEEEAAALLAKYYPNDKIEFLRYKVSDQVFMYYYSSCYYMVFIFEDYVVVLDVGEVSPAWNNDNPYALADSIVCPTVRDLFTKSTSKETAEELYNLWKDALK